MTRAEIDPPARAVFSTEGMLDGFYKCHENLEVVQKGLNDYLETKRFLWGDYWASPVK